MLTRIKASLRTAIRFILWSFWTAFISMVIVIWLTSYTKYSDGDKLFDALQCLNRAGGKLGRLTFKMTGVLGDRYGDRKRLSIIGHEDKYGGEAAAAYCRLQGESMEVQLPGEDIIFFRTHLE